MDRKSKCKKIHFDQVFQFSVFWSPNWPAINEFWFNIVSNSQKHFGPVQKMDFNVLNFDLTIFSQIKEKNQNNFSFSTAWFSSTIHTTPNLNLNFSIWNLKPQNTIKLFFKLIVTDNWKFLVCLIIVSFEGKQSISINLLYA